MLLTTIFYLFSLYPEVLTKLRAEVTQYYKPGEIPTYENIKRLRYCELHTLYDIPSIDVLIPGGLVVRAVINETLRVYPPVRYRPTHMSCIAHQRGLPEIDQPEHPRDQGIVQDPHIGPG